jgi:hypothetical protein
MESTNLVNMWIFGVFKIHLQLTDCMLAGSSALVYSLNSIDNDMKRFDRITIFRSLFSGGLTCEKTLPVGRKTFSK